MLPLPSLPPPPPPLPPPLPLADCWLTPVVPRLSPVIWKRMADVGESGLDTAVADTDAAVLVVLVLVGAGPTNGW